MAQTSIYTTLAQSKEIANAVLKKVKDKNYLTAADIDSYTITKQATADSGFSATYQLFRGDTAVGDKINIPKDMVIESGEVKTATAADVSAALYTGIQAGDKYIDLVIANKDSSHIYIPVSDLVDVYTAGNGIDLNNGAFSLQLDSTGAGGLTLSAAGLKLSPATPDTYSGETKTADGVAGAMSSADKYKLDNIEAGANKYEHPAYSATTGAETANQTPAFGATFNVSQVTSDAAGHVTGQTTRTVQIPNAVAVPNSYDSSDQVISPGSAGLMSVADKEKLDSIRVATSAEVTAMIGELDSL